MQWGTGLEGFPSSFPVWSLSSADSYHVLFIYCMLGGGLHTLTTYTYLSLETPQNENHTCEEEEIEAHGCEGTRPAGNRQTGGGGSLHYRVLPSVFHKLLFPHV